MDWKTLARLAPDSLRSLQESRLRRFFREQVPLSPHYRALFERERIDPERVRRLEDLRRFPFTTKLDFAPTEENPNRPLDFVLRPEPDLLKRHWPKRRLVFLKLLGKARARSRLEREYRPVFPTFTTGRSAAPVSFLYSAHDLRRLRDAGARICDVLGIGPADRAANLFPFAPHLAFWQMTFAGLEAGLFCLGTGGGRVMGSERTVAAISRMKATTLVGVPGFVYHCLRKAAEMGVRLPEVRTVVLGAEKLPLALRERIAETLRAMGASDPRILGTYGFTEARMAWTECPAPLGDPTGYHLYPDMGIFEVVDPETGDPRRPGDDGELVFTPLDARGTVVLRYRTGDLVQGGIDDSPCPRCGRRVPRISPSISRVSNRADLRLVKLKGTLVDLDALGGVLGSFREVEEWQVELAKANDDPFGLDEIVVHAALANGADEGRFRTRLAEAMRGATEVAPNRVEIRPLRDMLERLGMESEMKEKRYLDRRPKA